MDLNNILTFLESTSARLENNWQMTKLNYIAQSRIPDFITGKQDSILRADIVTLWTRWFLESICDTECFMEGVPNYAHIVDTVKNEVQVIFSNMEVNKHRELIKQISFLLYQEIQRRQAIKRKTFDNVVNDILWDLYGPKPRCWICGYQFSQWAIDKFLKNEASEEIPEPLFIDYLKPRGLNRRDFQIEIDHVFPLSDGGGEEVSNLKFACGWCNSYKSNRLSIYDVTAKPSVIQHPKFGRTTVPHPFWCVRLLSLHRQCEHEKGCDKTIENSELTITSRHQKGSMNPINLRVTCDEHDHLGSDRFISMAWLKSFSKSN